MCFLFALDPENAQSKDKVEKQNVRTKALKMQAVAKEIGLSPDQIVKLTQAILKFNYGNAHTYSLLSF